MAPFTLGPLLAGPVDRALNLSYGIQDSVNALLVKASYNAVHPGAAHLEGMAGREAAGVCDTVVARAWQVASPAVAPTTATCTLKGVPRPARCACCSVRDGQVLCLLPRARPGGLAVAGVGPGGQLRHLAVPAGLQLCRLA